MKEIFPDQPINPNAALTYRQLVYRFITEMRNTADTVKAANELQDLVKSNNGNGFPMIIQHNKENKDTEWSRPVVCMDHSDIPRNTTYKHLATNVPVGKEQEAKLYSALIRNM